MWFSCGCISCGSVCSWVYEELNDHFRGNRRGDDAESSEASNISDPHEAAARALANNGQQQNEEITNTV